MFFKKTISISALMLAATLTLSGCQSSEEKAEGYYQSGLELLAKGDEDRALVEFRNVFKYNGLHKDARNTYADVMVKRGNLREAYSQYLLLVEQYPDLVDVRLTLAEMAMRGGNWTEVERHGRAALALNLDLPRAKAIGLALDYRDASLARDETQRVALAKEAAELVKTNPKNLVLHRILIDNAMNSSDPQTAMPEIEAALALEPQSREFQTQKLRLLNLSADMAATGAQLKTMVELFPDDEQLKTSLISWYMTNRDFDGAEAFLRKEAGDITGDTKKHLAVVQILNFAHGRDAGREELAKLIAGNTGTPQADFYGSALAGMDFEDGKHDEAIAAMDAIISKAEDSDQTRALKATLARMLDATGDTDRAKAVVAEVLTADPSNVVALKLRAKSAILDDRAGDAIIDLRSAQGQAPRDPEIMLLLAAAFERDGNTDLMGEQLAKAVEASGSGADASLRYAAFLSQQGRSQVAESVLSDARRAAPQNPEVLAALAQVLLEQQKWPQVNEIASSLRQINTAPALQIAERLDAAVLLGTDQIDEGLALLEQQAASSKDNLGPTILVITTQLRAGKIAEARNFLDAALAKSPDNQGLRLISANVDALLGKTDVAEATYRALIDEEPKAEVPVRMLYGLLVSLKRPEDAATALEVGLANQPESATLLWIKAGLLEKAGDIDGSIALYEKLYLNDSSNFIMANNLASMITSYRDDPASLERAFAIARRLRDSEQPAFQDTYGWIEYRRGNLEDALRYLEPAAKGIPNDPLVQFHLGMVYADLARKDEAVAQLQKAQKLGEGLNLPFMATLEARLKVLTATP